jgi:hypothetical protein
MNAAFLRHIVSQRPFRKCRLVLTGGAEVPVSSPGRITIPDNDTAKVQTEDGSLHIIDLRHLVEVRS